MVAVLHDLNQAARYADHLIAMRDGADRRRRARPREVVTAELVREVFGLDCVVVPGPVTGAPLVVPALPDRDPPGRIRPERTYPNRTPARVGVAVGAPERAGPHHSKEPDASSRRASPRPRARRRLTARRATGDRHHTVEITHAMGTTEVPAEPKRVVVLDTDKIDTALTLGVTPVGAARAGELNELADLLRRGRHRHHRGRHARRARPGGDRRAASPT